MIMMNEYTSYVGSVGLIILLIDSIPAPTPAAMMIKAMIIDVIYSILP